jgi:hypothetical protein
MPPSAYIETSIVSYLVARPSRDPIMAERQRQTRDWWENRRGEYWLFSSPYVLREVVVGEAAMAHDRVAALKHTTMLQTRPEVEFLAEVLVSRGPLPKKAKPDALHIALATVSDLDFLITWNLRHIANPRMYATIERLCRERGYRPPVLCTPQTLLDR